MPSTLKCGLFLHFLGCYLFPKFFSHETLNVQNNDKATATKINHPITRKAYTYLSLCHLSVYIDCQSICSREIHVKFSECHLAQMNKKILNNLFTTFTANATNPILFYFHNLKRMVIIGFHVFDTVSVYPRLTINLTIRIFSFCSRHYGLSDHTQQNHYHIFHFMFK